MSRFAPPLSRTTAALLALGAALVVAFVLYAAYRAPTAKTVVSTVEAVTP